MFGSKIVLYNCNNTKNLVNEYRRNLSSVNCNFIQVDKHTQVLNLLETDSPELVIIDCEQPQLSFFELLNAYNRPLTSFIIVAVDNNVEAAVEVMKLGAKDYLVRDEKLWDKLSDIIETKTKYGNLHSLDALSNYNMQLAEILNNITDVISIVDGRGVMKYVSPNIKKYFGWEVENLIGFESQKLAHPDDLGYFGKRFIEVLNTPDKPFDVRFRHKCKDGSFKPVHLIAKNLLHVHGIEGVLVNFHDITGLVQTEKALEASEDLHKKVLININSAVVVHAADTSIILANPKACELLGLSEQQIKGKNAIDTEWHLFREDGTVLPFDEFPVNVVLQTKNVLINLVVGVNRPVTKDRIWVLVNGFPVLNDNDEIEQIIISFFEITSIKESEKALQESEKRFRSIIENTLLGYFFIDSAGNYKDINNAWLNLHKFNNKEDVIGKSMEVVHRDDDFNETFETLQSIIDTKGYIYGDYKHVRANGSIGYHTYSVKNVYKEDEVVGVEGFIIDTTERHLAEETLKERNDEYLAINEELQESIVRIHNINTELEKAKIKAEESDHLKTAFLTNVSHEIRTPMNGILGFTELLRSTEVTAGEQQEYLKIIENSGKRMLKTINDLIDTSKIESGQVELDMNYAPIYPMVNEQYGFFKHEIISKGITFNFDNTGKNDEICSLMDKSKIEQVISNLLSNAVKFTTKGEISLGYNIGKEFIEFYVSDTGVGIEKELHSKIFERFRQADNSLSRGFEGAGLGLSISQAFVELHGGEIWVDSKVGEGSTFYFKIPLKVDEDSDFKVYEQSEEANPSTSNELTLLVAEDDDISFVYIQEIVKVFNAEIIHAKNGQIAVEHVKNNKNINLVLMDIKMPVMNGFDATVAIKSLRPDLPVIAQTAFAHTNDRQKALDAGCDDYISKPVKRETLIEMINKYGQTDFL